MKGFEEGLSAQMLPLHEAREQKEREERERELADAAARQAADDEAAAAEGRASHHEAAAPPKASTVSRRGTSGTKASAGSELKYRIVDEAKLPDEYVERVPRRSKILADVRSGIYIPGVEPYEEKKVRAR